MADAIPFDGASGPGGERVLVRRSARRRRTVSITRRDGDLLVSMPTGLSRREESQWVTRMIDDLHRKERAATPVAAGDDELLEIAELLSRRYFGGAAHPAKVSWSTRQQRRWGSCTTSSKEIRISTRLRTMPRWVLEYVLVHELAHLFVDGHGPDFHALLSRYPKAERARGFLEGITHADGRPPEDDGWDEPQ